MRDDVAVVARATPRASSSARARTGDASASFSVSTVAKSLGDGDVVTPFDARRATMRARGHALTFEDVTALMRSCAVADEEGASGAQRGVRVREYLRALERATTPGRSGDADARERARETSDDRDPLRELARELLPEWRHQGGSPGPEPKPELRGTKKIRDGNGRRDDAMRELEETIARMSKEAREAEAVKDEALRMKSASLVAVTTENEMLRLSLASAHAAKEEMERRLYESEAKEVEARETLRECMATLHEEQMGREKLRDELTKVSEELHRAHAAAEEAMSTEMNLELRLRSLRNGDLLAALRERVIETQNELKLEVKAHDLARRRFARELTKKEAFACRIRDKARALGMCLELLEDRDSLASGSETDD